MILIFSNKNDYTCKIISMWICYFSGEFIRLNREQDYLDLDSIIFNTDFQSIEFSMRDRKINLSEIKSVFIRGGAIRNSLFVKHPGEITDFKSHLQYFLSAFSIAKMEFCIYCIEKIKVIGGNSVGRFNKIIALENAKATGLNIPATLITTRKDTVVNFSRQHDSIITKSLDCNFYYTETKKPQKKLYQYTSEVSKEFIDKMMPEFQLTLFQEKIIKKFEIRTFYLNEKCFSSVIFSQQNEKTSIDYRKYDSNRMNRQMPFKLPIDIENKIIIFMTKCGLNTGSIDFIYGIDKIFYFLEVNPIGQFGYLSNVTNYKLEKEIASQLNK